MLPFAITHFHEIHHRFGRIVLYRGDNLPLLYVHASGYIGPKMLQEVLQQACRFGQSQPQGWDYVVDTIELTIAHPLNPIWLHKIHQLPHLNRYIVIHPHTFPQRLLIPLIKGLIKPDLLLSSVDQLENFT